MKKTVLITLITSLMVTLVSFAAFGKAQQPLGKPGPGKGNLLFAELKLTEEQLDKIMAIRQQYEKDMIDLRYALQKKNRELAKLWAAKPLDQAAIDAKTKEVNAIRIQMRTKRDTMKEQIKAVLTPEQLKVYNEKMKNNKNRRPGLAPGGRCQCGGKDRAKR